MQLTTEPKPIVKSVDNAKRINVRTFKAPLPSKETSAPVIVAPVEAEVVDMVPRAEMLKIKKEWIESGNAIFLL